MCAGEREGEVACLALLDFSFGQDLQLVLKIGNGFLVFLAKHVSRLLRLQMDIFEQLAQFSQLGVAFLVDLQLRGETRGDVSGD